jgi:hypothetical protein
MSHCLAALAALFSGDAETARRHLAESMACVAASTLLQEAVQALLCVSLFLARQGDEIAAARLYGAIRDYPQIVNSEFCRAVAGQDLERVIEGLSAAERQAVEGQGYRLDIQTLAAQMCADLLA